MCYVDNGPAAVFGLAGVFFFWFFFLYHSEAILSRTHPTTSIQARRHWPPVAGMYIAPPDCMLV